MTHCRRRGLIHRGGGGGSGTEKFVYQKWPGRIFRMANFVFSRDGHFGPGGGGSRGGGVPPPPPMGWCKAILILPLERGGGGAGRNMRSVRDLTAQRRSGL